MPTSGTYAWVLRAVGSADAPRFGLSLIHPQAPTVERLVEAESAALSDVRLVSAGSVDSSGRRASSIRPYSLLYIASGDVRSLPLEANGTPPRDRVQPARTTDACRFIADGNDLAQPTSSRYMVATAGSDGRCGTSDDGFTEITLSSTGAPRVAAGSGDKPLAVARDPVSQAPRGWVFPRRVVFWGSGSSSSSVATRASGEPSFTTVVLNSPRGALVDDGSRLSVLEFRSDASVGVRPLESALTSGGSWQPVGFDADAFYVFRNSGNNSTSRWSVVRVSRSAFSATVLASGDGLMTNAAIGSGRLYATVLGAQNNRLLGFSKQGAAAPTVLEETALNTYAVVLTGNASVHQLFRVTNIGTATPAYAIEFIDETGARLYRTSVGGYPVATAEPTAVDYDKSENRSRFLFVTGYGSRAFGDTALLSYDTAARSALTLGTLPGLADYGQSIVYANVTAGPGSFGGVFVARSTGNQVETSGAKVYSVDSQAAGSLKAAAAP